MRTLQHLVRACSLAVAGLALGVSTAWSADIWLEAKQLGPTEYPAGIPSSVPMWGYASCDANWTLCGAHSVPGPQLVVPDSETSLTIHLKNSLLTAATSIVIPGQREDIMGAANSPSGGASGFGRAFTHEVLAGGNDIYTWTTLAAGTYLYHSGSHAQVQVPMGLYGGMKHDAAVGFAYAGVNYDNETMLLFSEVDPILNAAVANGTYGTAPAPTSAIGYRPQHFLINGVAYVPTVTTPIPVTPAGARTLLRFLNAGLQSHVPTLQNGFFHLKAEDGHLLPHGGHEQYAALLAAGKTLDAIWLPTTGIHSLYDQSLNDSMLVKLAVGVLVAQGDAYFTPEGQQLIVTAPGVLGNDGGTAPTAQLFSPVTVGILNLALDGSFTYQPPVGFSGIATFQYQAVDGGPPSNTATVTITVTAVNDPPVANPDAATAKTAVPAQIAVLANDTDVDDAPSALRVDSVTTPTTNGGIASVTAGGLSVTYTSALGFTGADTFDYVTRDAAGALSAAATVTVTVSANLPPVAVADNPPAILEDSLPLVISVLANDSDPDLDTLSVSAVDQPTPANGGMTATNGTTVTYTPTPNFNGVVTFLYTVFDGTVSSQALVTITVNPVNDAPVAVNDEIWVTRHGTFTALAPGVLANDTDPDSPTLTAILATGLNLGKGTLTLGSNGTVTYTPTLELVGGQTFTYRANDSLLSSAPATVTLRKPISVKKAAFTDRTNPLQDKWSIAGKANAIAGTSVTIYNGATPGGAVIATVPVVAGAWKYERTGSQLGFVAPDGSGFISVQGSAGGQSFLTDVPVIVTVVP